MTDEKFRTQIKDIILNTKVPLVVRNAPISWDVFQGSLEDWCGQLDQHSESPIAFEQIQKENGSTPQWERRRNIVKMKAVDFLNNHAREDGSCWTAVNYKRAFELDERCLGGISFDCFGFPNSGKDFSFWLGSTGANTPCHYDTYGCNVVVQLFGEKSWLLFPPDTPLTSTRIPYEESSVYCLENFYSPDPQKLSHFKKVESMGLQVTLKPKDVLIVPPQWWHYVETLKTSLSVNYWVPLETDVDKQLEECIVKYLIESIIQSLSAEEKLYVLNPNQNGQGIEKEDLLKIFTYLLESKLNRSSSQKSHPYAFKTQKELEGILSSLSTIEKPKFLTKENFMEILKLNSNRFKVQNGDSSPLSFMQEILINSILNPVTIESIKKDFLMRCKSITDR